MVSQLHVQGEKTLEEIAGYDSRFMRCVLLRKRDKYGRLKRASDNDDLPEGYTGDYEDYVDENGQRVVRNQAPGFAAAFAKAAEESGASRESVAARWEQFEQDNPEYQGDVIERG